MVQAIIDKIGKGEIIMLDPEMFMDIVGISFIIIAVSAVVLVIKKLTDKKDK